MTDTDRRSTDADGPDRDGDGADPLGPGGYDLAAVLPYAIVRTGLTLGRAFAAALRPLDLTPRQFGILFQFAGERVTTAAEIARALEVTPQSIGAQVDALQSRGLIRATQVPGRGRPIELRLTTAGHRRLQRALAVAREHQTDLVGFMSRAEQATMLGHLRTMVDRADGGGSEGAGAGGVSRTADGDGR